MQWWTWVVGGLVCLAVEVLTPGAFGFVFFGVAAIVVGALTAGGLLTEFWQQSAVGVGLAAVLLAALRRRLMAWVAPRQRPASVDSLVGEWATVQQPIEAAQSGKVEYRGSLWTAYNAGDKTLSAGVRGRIFRVDGLTLWIKSD